MLEQRNLFRRRHGTYLGDATLASFSNPDSLLDLALPSWISLPVTVPIARQSILWPWNHRDPADRLLAATAAVHGLELWHTDRILRGLTGFPHRYFVNAL